MSKKLFYKTLDNALGKKYSIVSSFVLDKNSIAFIAAKPHKDNWNSHLKLLAYLPEKTGEQWYSTELNGIWGLPWFGGALNTPKHQFMFISESGHVHTVGGGTPLTPQNPISNSRAALNTTDSPALFFHNAKSIEGKIYAINNMRIVVKFTDNKWIQLKNGLPDYEEIIGKESGFSDIDGFSEDDIYAGGGNGDLWHWNGKKWKQIDCPTNAFLDNICCGDDGLVYITMNKNAILCGRGDNWEFINQNMTDNFESIVWFKDRIYLSSSHQLFQIKDKKFSAANEGEFRSLIWGNLSVGNGIMVAALGRRIGIYDGKTWAIISE